MSCMKNWKHLISSAPDFFDTKREWYANWRGLFSNTLDFPGAKKGIPTPETQGGHTQARVVYHVFLGCEKLWKLHGSTWYISHLRNFQLLTRFGSPVHIAVISSAIRCEETKAFIFEPYLHSWSSLVIVSSWSLLRFFSKSKTHLWNKSRRIWAHHFQWTSRQLSQMHHLISPSQCPTAAPVVLPILLFWCTCLRLPSRLEKKVLKGTPAEMHKTRWYLLFTKMVWSGKVLKKPPVLHRPASVHPGPNSEVGRIYSRINSTPRNPSFYTSLALALAFTK